MKAGLFDEIDRRPNRDRVDTVTRAHALDERQGLIEQEARVQVEHRDVVTAARDQIEQHHPGSASERTGEHDLAGIRRPRPIEHALGALEQGRGGGRRWEWGDHDDQDSHRGARGYIDRLRQ